MSRVAVVVGELVGLLGNGIGDFLAAITDVHAVEACKTVEKFGPLAVLDEDAFAAFHDARVAELAARMVAQHGEGM